jgi:protein-disulfide isomerase
MSDDKFKACMSDSALENQVRASRLLGEQYGVKSTPTFFINGTKVEGSLPISSFEKVLSQAAKS